MSTNIICLFSSKHIYLIIWIHILATAMIFLSQEKLIEILYLFFGKWDKLDKSGMVSPHP